MANWAIDSLIFLPRSVHVVQYLSFTFMFNFIVKVAIEKKETLFISDPTSIPGLEKNEDYVKFGYGYYVGAPWIVGQLRGNDKTIGACFFIDLYHVIHKLTT